MSDVLRCVVVGKTGVGKSSFCNLLANNKTCEISASSSSKTRNPQKVPVEFDMKHYEFIDFPGYCDTSLSKEEIEKILGNVVQLSLPGPHVFALVIKIGRFGDVEKEALLRITEQFGYEVFKYTVVIFTCKQELSYCNQSQEDCIRNLKSDLRQGQKHAEHFKYLIDILDKNRCVFVECYGVEKGGRSEAFAVIDQLKTKNRDEYYTNSMYQKAVEKKRQDELEKERQDKLEKERQDKLEKERRDKLEKEIQDKLEKERQDKLEKEKRMNKKLDELEEKKGGMWTSIGTRILSTAAEIGVRLLVNSASDASRGQQPSFSHQPVGQDAVPFSHQPLGQDTALFSHQPFHKRNTLHQLHVSALLDQFVHSSK